MYNTQHINTTLLPDIQLLLPHHASADADSIHEPTTTSSAASVVRYPNPPTNWRAPSKATSLEPQPCACRSKQQEQPASSAPASMSKSPSSAVPGVCRRAPTTELAAWRQHHPFRTKTAARSTSPTPSRRTRTPRACSTTRRGAAVRTRQ